MKGKKVNHIEGNIRYRIHGDALAVLEKKPIVKVNFMFVGSITIVGSNGLAAVIDNLDLGFGQLTNIITLFIPGSCILRFRVYKSKDYGKKMVIG